MFAIPHIRLSKRAVLGLGVLATVAALPAAQGQITYDAQIPFSFSSPTLMSPRGIAVAPNGTVYVADPEVGVVQITPTTGLVGGPSAGAALIASTAVTLNTTLKAPTAVAVDSNGNLYAADAADGKVVELPYPVTSSTPVTVTYSGTETPTALAVDPNNNLYIADENREAIYKVVKGTASKLNINMPENCFLIFCSQPPLQPLGLAADANGDVYFANDDNTVYEYSATTGRTESFLANPNAGNWEFSANAAKYPIGMGLDPAGDLYVMDSGSGNLIEITSSTNYQLPLSSSVIPDGLAVSSIGNLYISDDSANTVDEVFYNNNPFNFGPVEAGTNSPAVTVNFQFNSRGRDLATYQTLQGDITTEFKTLSATCTGTTGSECSMAYYVDYSSALPGTQNGLVGLANTDSGAIYAVPNTGIALASTLALYPGTQATLSQSSQTLYEPQGLAVTGSGGTLFVADEGGIISGGKASYKHGNVWAYAATAGTPGGTPADIGNFATPDAVALDSAGNLYVADYSGTVTKIPASYSVNGGGVGSTSWPGNGTKLTFPAAAALTHPMSLAFDPSGNLYIGDMGSAGVNATASQPGYIVKVPANGGPAVRLNYKLGGISIVFPQALATDSQGNLYIADAGDQITDAGGVDVVSVATGNVSQISFGSFGQLSQPSGLSFDAANDLYVLDGYNQRVLVVPMTFAGTVPTADTDGISLLGQGVSGITSAIVTPSNLVVWPGGQYITISDIGFQPATGPSNPVQVLTLQAVNATVGASSGTASVTGVNVGNEEITFAAPTSSGNTAFTLSGCGSTSGSTLATGITAGCTTTITYTANGTSQSDIFTLNGNLAADGSALGNQISVSGASEEPVGVWSGGGQQTSQFGATVTLTNTGVLPLNITAVGFTNGSKGGVTDLTGTCTLLPNLSQNQSCTVTFTFTAANDNATINVTDNNEGGTNVIQSVAVSYGVSGDVQNSLAPTDSIPRNLLDRGNSNNLSPNNSNGSNNQSNTTGRKGGR